MSAQVFSSRQNLSTNIDVHGCTNAAKAWMPRSCHVGNAASGDLDHLKMITYLVRLVLYLYKFNRYKIQI